MIQTQTKFKTAPGHQVLAAAGKKTLRPKISRISSKVKISRQILSSIHAKPNWNPSARTL